MLDAKWRLVTCLLVVILSILHPCDTFFGISIKREDDSNTCYYDGGRHQCTFFLFCGLIGGSSVGSCPGSLLSTCCVTQSNHVRRSPTKVQSNSLKTYAHLPDSLDQRVLSKDKAVCGQRVYKPTSRIVGGNAAEFGEFPWQAHIKITQQQCGGVLLNHNYVVTAAHCVYRALLHDIVVVLGAYDIHDQRYQLLPAQKFRVVEKLLHPNFRFSPSHPDRFDVALIRLDRPVRYQENVLPICLPPYGWNFQGWRAIITGWGKTDPALRVKFKKDNFGTNPPKYIHLHNIYNGFPDRNGNPFQYIPYDPTADRDDTKNPPGGFTDLGMRSFRLRKYAFASLVDIYVYPRNPDNGHYDIADDGLYERYGTRLLQKVEVPIISNKECEMWHHWKGINVRIFPEMMCAGYEGGRKDACVGDSGGPLIVYLDGRWTLVGIISAGFGCAQWRQPGIYHSVSSTVDWISSHIS